MPDARQLRGMSLRWASLFGMPHLGARYVGGRWELDSERCAVCGRMATNCHHAVPRSVAGSFALSTPRGTWELRSPLFALCGSGTTGCHDGFHGGARYAARWEWDDPGAEEAWWDGTILSGTAPHDPALYGLGHWEIDDRRTGATLVRRGEWR